MIPSGKLWIINTIVVIIPSLYKLFDFRCFSTLLSIEVDKIIPMIIKIAQIMNAGNGLNNSASREADSGISETNDIVIITPLAKANALAIIRSCFFVFRKQGIIPSTVEKPAINVIIKLNIMLFILEVYAF